MDKLYLTLAFVNAGLILIIIPLYGIKKRLNFWKEPISHFEDRKDTQKNFDIIFMIFVLNQALICLKINQDYLPIGIISSASIILSVFFRWKEHHFIHNLFSWVGSVGFLFYSLATDYQIYQYINKTLGVICFIITFSMLTSLIYIINRKLHSNKNPVNTVGEYLLLIPIIVWNFLLVSL